VNAAESLAELRDIIQTFFHTAAVSA
jgi:hypothetical protein